MESQSAVLFPRKPFRRLLVPVAAAAFLALAGMVFLSPGVRAAQATTSEQPAKSPQQAPPAPEGSPAQAPQPAAATSSKTPVEATPNAGAGAAGASESGGSQVVADCASLLKLATDLKAEVDKTTKEELSVGVVRKAGEIEQLARKVREKKGN